MTLGRNDLCFCGSGKKYKRCHPDINPDSLIAGLINYYKKLDAIILEGKANGKCNLCRESCNTCCNHYFAISSTEFDYIAYEYTKRYGLNKWQELTSKAKVKWEKFREHNKETAEYEENMEEGGIDVFNRYLKATGKCKTTHEDSPCLFLNEVGQCSIYDIRPFICRFQGYFRYDDSYENMESTICEVLGKYRDNCASLLLSEEILNENSEFIFIQCKEYSVYDRPHSLTFLLSYSDTYIRNPLTAPGVLKRYKLSKDEFTQARIAKMEQTCID
jgi:Fe-S-cluster containining protein